MIEQALKIKNVLNQNLFIITEPEVLDFTHPKNPLLHLFSANYHEILSLEPKTLISVMGLLNAGIFQTEITIIGWNLKSLFSFVKFFTNSIPELTCKIIDLKITEAFLGLRNKAPASFTEALYRTKAVFQDSWQKTKVIYNQIHQPLITRVLPTIETQSLFDKNTRKPLYSHYEVEGQSNGRLKTEGLFKHNFIPHALGPADRERLRPDKADHVFMYLDYAHMEVSVLQWLSGDVNLKQILDLDEDLYKVVFKLISGGNADEAKREMCKGFFLPTFYGMGTTTLAEKSNISLKTAEGVGNRLRKLFPTAFRWLDEQKIAIDIFGRKRILDKEWHVRNFIVQSPAATICQEKLICLHDAIKNYARICASIHDGYILLVPKASVKMVESMAKEVLNSESSLAAGLKLKVTCKTGETLNF